MKTDWFSAPQDTAENDLKAASVDHLGAIGDFGIKNLPKTDRLRIISS